MVFRDRYRTFEARSVSDGLTLFQMKQPNVVTLDLCMPHTDGLEGLRQLRRLDAKVPIIVLTGNSTHQSAKEALRLGATDYVEKPFDAADITSTVLRHLQSSSTGPKTRKLPTTGIAATSTELLECLHDLSNPMTIIALQCEYIDTLLQAAETKKKAVDLQKIRTSLDTVMRQARHSRELLTQWKDLGKLSRTEAQNINLGDVLSEVADDLLPVTTEHAVSIYWRQPSQPVPILGYRRELTRMFSNLVLNAIQACPPKQGRVTIGCHTAPDSVRIDITDNGPGISPAMLSHIFRPFFTTKGAAGTGLGLHIARRIALAHRGRVEVQSLAGQGCTFSVFLPRSVAA